MTVCNFCTKINDDIIFNDSRNKRIQITNEIELDNIHSTQTIV